MRFLRLMPLIFFLTLSRALSMTLSMIFVPKFYGRAIWTV